VPLNEAEAVFEAFWDERLSPAAHYTLEAPEPRRGERATQFWCWVALAWDGVPRARRASRGLRPVLSYERNLRVTLAGYDRMIVRVACPPHVSLSVTVTVDGRDQRIIRREPGTGRAHEFEGRFRGKVLERIRLELFSSKETADEVWLYWIGCANAGGRARMLARKPPFDSRWEGWLLPEGSPVEFKPRLGLFFGGGELDALRAKALSPAYRPIMDQLRAQAAQAMADPATPESLIGPHLAAGDVWAIQCRERNAGTRSFQIDAPVCAFVGLIDRDPQLLRFAARIAVSIAHNGSWVPHFMQDFPGSSWDTRGIPESFACASLALALDWAGAWFTPNGEHLVRYAIATKGLPRAREVFLQYEYMWNCNQHHMVGLGRLLGLLVLQKAWPRTIAEIEVFERDLAEIIDRYIQPDGSTDEGVGYWSNSFRSSLPALSALARFRGRPLRELVPAKVRSMDSYISAFLSTAGEPGSYHPVSDTVGDSVALDAIAMMDAAVGTPLWRGLMADVLRRGKKVKRDWTFDGCFAVIHGPERATDDPVVYPPFTKLAKAGSVSSFRRLGDSTVRLFLVGAMQNAGHGHRDKGSFMLEAGGEGFAVDRGAVPYEDATNLPFMKTELAHNLAVPEGCTQRNPSPSASDWTATGDEVSVRASVDTGETWQAPVLACRRSVFSPTPDRIEITDEFVLERPLPVSFLLHTPLPVEATGTCATIRGSRLNLEVAAPWAVAGTVEACGVNWSYTPINRLALRSAPATRHRLVTLLQFKLRS
jgi:Heparinase II/III-like protein